MIARHLHTVHELLSVLAQPTAEMRCLRELLCEHGRFPARRTWERRLKTLPETLPAQIGCLGRHLVELIHPWSESGRAVAIDSTVLRSRGAVWHQKHRQNGEVPHTLIDTEAHWTKSGWHGWVYGWKLHVVSVVAGVWFPVAALLTPANVADNTPAPTLLREVPAEVRFVLGDRHYNTPELRRDCALSDRELVATRLGSYPHTDAGVEVRRVFHKLCSIAMENFNEHFKSIFACAWASSHKRIGCDATLCTWRGFCLSTQPLLPLRERSRLVRWAESLSQSRARIYDQASTK